LNLGRHRFWLIVPVVFGVELLVHELLGHMRLMTPLATAFADALTLAILSLPFVAFMFSKRVARLRAESQAESIMQSSLDGILTSDLDGRLSRLNASAEKIFGYQSGEVAGRHIGILLPERRRTPARGTEAHFLSGAVDAATPRVVRVEGRRRNGKLFPAEVITVQAKDGDRTVRTTVVHDLTGRVRSEQARMASEERYHSLFASMLNGFAYCQMVYDASGRPVDFVYLEVNEAFERVTGLSNVVGRPIGELLPGIHAQNPELLESYGRVASTLVPESFEMEFEFTEGAQWLNISVSSAKQGHFAAVFDDITTRKQAEQDRALQLAALNSAADPIVITKRDGTITWVNAAFTATTGYGAEEAIGRNPRALLKSGAHDGLFYKQLWETILAGNVWRGELINRRKDGSRYPEMNSITPVRGSKGEISHFIAVKRDLTKEKQLQSEYLQAQKLESVGRLVGGIAHDFNNLLSVIIGWTELAMAELPSAHESRPPLEEVLNAGHGAARLTRQLLAFSRRQNVELTVFDVNALVADVEKMVRRLVGEDVKFVIRATPEANPVRMDRGQLEQVLMNLVVNARDAMPAGGQLTIETATVRVEAEAHADLPAGEYVSVAVSDSGTGMNDDVKAHLFEPFFTTKERGKGTGLGLATCYGIVQQASGHIDVRSEDGAGSTLTVYLPLTHQAPGATGVSTTGTTRGAETILVVDDDASVRRMTARVLETRGYRVLSVASGLEALQLLEARHEPVQLLLTDVVLADGMSGPLLAERVRLMRPEMKVLFVSGYTSDVTLLHGLRDLGDAFVQKPFTADTLCTNVRQLMAAPRRAITAGPP
jgi:PAS domain S-box-containing protein